MSETIWRPVADAIAEAKANDGWIGRCLFAKARPHGWEVWVGNMVPSHTSQDTLDTESDAIMAAWRSTGVAAPLDLAAALGPSQESLEAIRRMVEAQAVAAHAARNLLVGSAEGVAAPAEQPSNNPGELKAAEARRTPEDEYGPAHATVPARQGITGQAGHVAELEAALSACCASLAEAEGEIARLKLNPTAETVWRQNVEGRDIRIMKLEQALADQEHDTTQAKRAANAEVNRSARLEKALEKIASGNGLTWRGDPEPTECLCDWQMADIARAALKETSA